MNKSKEERLKELTPIQFEVTQNGATERPFTGEYINMNDIGIYVDIVSSEPLFTSRRAPVICPQAGSAWIEAV